MSKLNKLRKAHAQPKSLPTNTNPQAGQSSEYRQDAQVRESGAPGVQTVADQSKLLLDVHLNEYQALTNRATYYMVISSSLPPVVVVYLTLLVTAWQRLPEFGFPIMVWAGGFGVQLALLFWTFLVCEQYKTVLYVERDLRPLVQLLVGTSRFWLYEKKLRPKAPLTRWLELQTECWVLGAIIAAVLFRIALFHDFSLWDYIGLGFNVVVFLGLIGLAVSAAKIRHKWEDWLRNT